MSLINPWKRWTLRFSYKGVDKYVLTHDRPFILTGYIMGDFYKKKTTNKGWDVYLDFMGKQKIELNSSYFQDKEKVSQELINLIRSIDSSPYSYNFSDPSFYSVSPLEIIPLFTQELLMEKLQNMGDLNYQPPFTFNDAMRKVFLEGN
jgi:hypothetical protein